MREAERESTGSLQPESWYHLPCSPQARVTPVQRSRHEASASLGSQIYPQGPAKTTFKASKAAVTWNNSPPASSEEVIKRQFLSSGRRPPQCLLPSPDSVSRNPGRSASNHRAQLKRWIQRLPRLQAVQPDCVPVARCSVSPAPFLVLAASWQRGPCRLPDLLEQYCQESLPAKGLNLLAAHPGVA